MSTSSKGYPLLPKRPPLPAAVSTLHLLSTAVMFASDGGAGPAEHPASANEDLQQQQMPVPFSGGRKPTPRFVHTVKHAGLECWHHHHNRWCRWSSGARDRSTVTTRAAVVPVPSSLSPFLPSSSLLSAPVCGPMLQKCLQSEDSRQSFFLPRHWNLRLYTVIVIPSKFTSPSLTLELFLSCKTCIHFYLSPILVLAHVSLQTFLDFSSIYALIE
jgi:hypothetical protein